MPKVSIGIPVYNGANYVGSALEAILGQTFQDLEVVICDNCSTDETAEICKSFAEKDSRVRYVLNDENIGASPNFNKVFHETTGEYFAWHAHDDYYEPTWLERCVEALDRDREVMLAYSLIQMLDMEGNPLIHDPQKNEYMDRHGNKFMGDDAMHIAEEATPDARFKSVIHKVCWCLQVFGLYRRSFLETSALQRSYYGGDKVLLADTALAGKFFQVEEKLFNKRVHPKMSFFQSTAEKAEWIDTKKPVKGMPQVKMVQDYIRGIQAANMTPMQRAMSIFAIAQMPFVRKNFWEKILVPGPQNYLGINFGSGARAS